ncbi:TolC family protein [Cronbergia sp. UHCC 0137]|uniref:TolC family protein n=1 Tax=Cronbergia sp. UHCC 0137 TaxID=3110239 RepID=UPI002B2089BD|nr:TolC family protein [Cronbergia sp. UHCC 0137]MEA5617838.1 TolC family protein [Cronbergia sp. UHCC 0137]
MKGQQLFHSLLPGVTAAVLTTQPTWAGVVKINGVQPLSSPNVLISTPGRALDTKDMTDKQLSQSTVNSYQALLPTANLTQLGVQPLSDGSLAEANFISIFGQKRPNTGLQISVAGVQEANFLESQQCPQVDKNSQAALLLTPSRCLQKNASLKLVAQANLPSVAEETVAPVPTIVEETVVEQTIPVPSAVEETVAPVPTIVEETVVEETIIEDTRGTVAIPENLNPNPDPLLFPSKPEEVTLGENQPITLEQALELAKRNNNDLQVSILQLERSRAALREAEAAWLPTLGLSTDITNSRSVGSSLQFDQARQTDPTVGEAPNNTDFSGSAQLTYDLYTSGRRRATVKENEERVRIQQLDVERQSEEIRLNVSTAYYDLQQADERVRITQSAVQNSEASLRDAQALERAGVGTRFDVLRSQVNLANAQQDLTSALSQQQVARRRLAIRLNTPQSVNISAADPVQLADLWNRTLEESIILAYQNRPELQQQLAQGLISEAQRRQALASLGPQVSLVARYDLLDRFDDNTNVSDGYSVGVRATLNLYDGGAARARAAQAKANIAIAQTQFSEQRNQVRFQVEEAYSSQESNLKNVQTANAALEQAKESLRLARLRFQAGVGTQTDVINSENDLTRAEGNRITAILDYNRALTQLQRSVTFRALNK